jgi:hypothetical protein
MAALGDDHGERLADVARLVEREERLARVEDAVRHGGLPPAGERELVVAHRRQCPLELGAGEHQRHAGRAGCAHRVDQPDASVRVRAAHEDGVQHAGQLEIGDVLPLAGEEPRVFPTRQRTAEKHPARLH